jgi:hypothetical protein
VQGIIYRHQTAKVLAEEEEEKEAQLAAENGFKVL